MSKPLMYTEEEFKAAVMRCKFLSLRPSREIQEICQAQILSTDPEWLNGYKPLVFMCENHKYNVAHEFLNADYVTVNGSKHDRNMTPLQLIVLHNNNWNKMYTEIIDKLLEKGADLNQENSLGQNPFDIALRLKRKESLKILINHVKNYNIKRRTYVKLLLDLIEHEYNDLAELLLTKCESININKYKSDVNFLSLAVQKKQHGVVRSLVNRGIDVNDYWESAKPNKSALYLACKIGDIEMVKFLLDNGANTDIPSKSFDSIWYISSFEYPIHAAVSGHNLDVVKELLDRGDDVNKTCLMYGNTPLHKACSCTDLKMVKLLIERGADLYIESKEKITPVASAHQLDEPPELFEYIFGLNNFRLTVGIAKSIIFDSIGFMCDTGLKFLFNYINNLDRRDYLRYELDVHLFNNNKYKRPLIHKTAMVSILCIYFIKKDFDVNLKDLKGRTPLHLVFRYKLRYSINVLIGGGADINARCNAGLLPIDYFFNEEIQRTRYDSDTEYYGGEMSEEHLEAHGPETLDYFSDYIMKLKYLNLSVDDENYNFALKHLGDPNKYNEVYKKETVKMRSEVISQKVPNVTYYDFIKGTLNARINLLYEKNILRVLCRRRNYCKKFPKFKDILSNLFEEVHRRKKLLDKCEPVFDYLCENLPYLCVDKITSYFNNNELKNLYHKITFF